MKIKTSFMIEESLWKNFKEEVAKRYHTNRKTVPPLSMIIEDLIRGYLTGLSGEKINLYEIASVIDSIGPHTLTKLAKQHPSLASRIFKEKPQSFIKVMTIDLDHKREDVLDVTWYEKKDDMIVEKVYLKDEPQLKNNPIDGFVWYIIGEDEGPPYFDGLFLNDLFGEGYAHIILHYLRDKEDLNGFIPFYETLSFSVANQDNWNTMLNALELLFKREAVPIKTEINEVTGYKIKLYSPMDKRVFSNSIVFLKELAGWIPKNIQYII